jgi:SOS-response transcriptional repressor LexA
MQTRLPRAGLPSLTQQQRRVWNLIRDLTKENNGRPPTLRDISDGMGFKSINGVVCHLTALEKKGFLVREAGQSRGIRIAVDEPIRVDRLGEIITLDCGDRLYNLDAEGAIKLARKLLELAQITLA